MKWSLSKRTEAATPTGAIALILTALLFLSLQDGLVKVASQDTSLWQFQFIRSLFNLAIVFAGVIAAGQIHLIRPINVWPVVARTAAIMVTMILFFSGAPFLTLAEMGAGLYTYPIFMTILSAIFLREHIGFWRILSVFLAALGAFLIIRPGSHSFQLAQLLPVGAGFFYSVNATILRKYCREESPVTMVAWAGFGFLIVSLLGLAIVAGLNVAPETRAAWPFVLTAWPTLSLVMAGLAVVCAVCNVVGNVLIVKAYQSSELSWIAPVDYSYLIFATIWGFVMFRDLPEWLTGAGMVLIAVAGSLTVWRQRLAARADPITSP